MFWWSIQSQICGKSSEGRNNYFLVFSCNEKKWKGFLLGRQLERSTGFIWIFMVGAFGWWRGPQEKSRVTEWSSPWWKALALSLQGSLWAVFVVWCNKSFMCRLLDLLVVWTQPLLPGGGYCVWRRFKELGLTWWAQANTSLICFALSLTQCVCGKRDWEILRASQPPLWGTFKYTLA